MLSADCCALCGLGERRSAPGSGLGALSIVERVMIRTVVSPTKASRNLQDPDDPDVPSTKHPPPSSANVPSLQSSKDDLLQLHEQLVLNLREQLATLDQSLNADTAPVVSNDERKRVALLVKLRGLVNGLRDADGISTLCALAERLESEEGRRSVRVGAGVAARYKAISRAAVRERFESDSAPCRALEVGEEIDVLESRVNSRGQLRVRFAGGWASVTALDGATLLEPTAVVNCEPQLYRVLNRVTIRVGADVVRLLYPSGAYVATAQHLIQPHTASHSPRCAPCVCGLRNREQLVLWRLENL